MSLSSSSFTDVASLRDGSNPSSPDTLGKCSVSEESAILLYQAFAGGHSTPLSGSRSTGASDEGGDMDVHSNHANNKARCRQDFNHNNMKTNEDIGQNHLSGGASPAQDPPPREDNHTSVSDGKQSVTQSGNSARNSFSNPQRINHDKNDEESTASGQSQLQSRLISMSSLLSQHRTKIGSLFISLASLWVYSRYKRKDSRDRRHHFQNIQSWDLHKKTLGIYKLLLQMLSRLRISSYLRQLSRRKISIGNASTASTRSPWDHATATPLSHLLAVAKSGNISKVMLHGSAVSYLHSMQSPSTFNGGQSNELMRQRWSKTMLPSNNPNFLQEILSTLLNHGCHDITTVPESLWQRFLNGPALVIFPFAYLGALYWIMRRLQRQQLEDGENDNSFSWNKNLGVKYGSSSHTTTFDDVAGVDSALQELRELISYMRNPNAFHFVGASPPRGILLHGSPGSGKTLLARAIAGEAGRRAVGATGPLGKGATIDCFVVCSGSDFVETYVGRGAARVRTLFRGVREEAWRNFEKRRREYKREVDRRRRGAKKNGAVLVKNAWDGVQSLLTQHTSSVIADDDDSEMCTSKPMAIIFIDEIDALAKRRDSGSGFNSSLGGCDEREQTLNQLLTEMDGFATSSSKHNMPEEGPSGVIVIVIAATNRPEVLDPAILRAGRFDRHVKVPLPDAEGREAILRVHARRIRLDLPSVNFRELANDKWTHNFSGADLKNVVNEAALLAVRLGHYDVKQQHFKDAIQKVKAMVNASHG